MNELISNQVQPKVASKTAISPLDLAKFLDQLTDIYASPSYGNPLLCDALRELALEQRANIKRLKIGSKNKMLRKLSSECLDKLRTLSPESIRTFLADKSKTKADLFELASARFSIPTSQLKRMKIEEVRQAINAALLHESSLEILSEEAGREGANRLS